MYTVGSTVTVTNGVKRTHPNFEELGSGMIVAKMYEAEIEDDLFAVKLTTTIDVEKMDRHGMHQRPDGSFIFTRGEIE